jgi:hypothetical protein
MGAKENYEARKAAEKAKQEADRGDRWWFNQRTPIDRFTGWLVAWTFLLFIATIGSAVVLWKTDNTLHETLAETKKSADAAEVSAIAAKNAVELADRTAERQLRAYISIKSISLSLVGTAAHSDVKIKNSGQTPANNLVVRGIISTGQEISQNRNLPAYFGNSPSNFGIVGLDVSKATNILGQGEDIEFSIFVGALSKKPPPKSPLSAFPSRLFVIGAVYYTDIFGKQRYSRFCNYFVSAAKNGYCAEHNDAN